MGAIPQRGEVLSSNYATPQITYSPFQNEKIPVLLKLCPGTLPEIETETYFFKIVVFYCSISLCFALYCLLFYCIV